MIAALRASIPAQRLFAAGDVIHPQFATHNAWTLAALLALAPQGAAYEFQRLHGMGQRLYEIARDSTPEFAPVRVYAPVGTDAELLPYLLRRLLENGASSSFVRHFLDRSTPVELLLADPVTLLEQAIQAAPGSFAAHCDSAAPHDTRLPLALR